MPRFVGNLIIIYEMFHKDEQEEAQLKLLEVGKWLEEIELNKENEFYLSYKNGIKHVLTSTFIHMLYATNLTEESKWVNYHLFYIIYILLLYYVL